MEAITPKNRQFNQHKALSGTMLNHTQEARRFYQATSGQWGTDSQTVEEILKKVATTHTQKAFDQAVRDEFAHQGKPVANTLEVLQQEFEGNAVSRFFCQSRLKRAQDFYYFGLDRIRGTANEYRKEGFWEVPAQMGKAIRKRPVTSVTLIGSIVYLGHCFPTLAALAGAGILLYSGTGFVMSEWQASRASNTPAQRAHALIQSGDNLSCLVMSLPGVTGIYKAFRGASKAAIQSFQTAEGSLFSRLTGAGKHALMDNSHLPNLQNIFGKLKSIQKASFKLKPLDTSTQLESTLMLMGLVDEPLVPFAKVNQKKNSHA